MKKIVLLLVLLAAVSSHAADYTITTNTTSVTVPASDIRYSQPILLTGKHGFFSVQLVTTGTGTLTLGYQMSNSDVAPQTWSLPSGGTTIATAISAGTNMYKFEPHTVARWLRLSFTETGTTNPVVVVSILAAQ